MASIIKESLFRLHKNLLDIQEHITGPSALVGQHYSTYSNKSHLSDDHLQQAVTALGAKMLQLFFPGPFPLRKDMRSEADAKVSGSEVFRLTQEYSPGLLLGIFFLYI